MRTIRLDRNVARGSKARIIAWAATRIVPATKRLRAAPSLELITAHPHQCVHQDPLPLLCAQSCGKTRHSASAAWIAKRADGYILWPETRWPYVGLIGASPGARQSSVFWTNPGIGAERLAGMEGWRKTGRLRCFVECLLRLRNHVAEHIDRRNLRRLQRVGRTISPHCGSLERRSGWILLVAAIHHKHVL
jgi:hypothetical protein